MLVAITILNIITCDSKVTLRLNLLNIPPILYLDPALHKYCKTNTIQKKFSRTHTRSWQTCSYTLYSSFFHHGNRVHSKILKSKRYFVVWIGIGRWDNKITHNKFIFMSCYKNNIKKLQRKNNIDCKTYKAKNLMETIWIRYF